MKNGKKLGALCCAIALAVTCAVPAFAAKNGWHLVNLPLNRTPKTLALAPHENSNLQYAEASVTHTDNLSQLWLRVFDNGTQMSVTDEFLCWMGESVDLKYHTPIKANRWLRLEGGYNNPLIVGRSSGECDFH